MSCSGLSLDHRSQEYSVGSSGFLTLDESGQNWFRCFARALKIGLIKFQVSESAGGTGEYK